MDGIRLMRECAEHERRRPVAQGALVRLADGHDWMLAEPLFQPIPSGLTSPVVDAELDRFYEQIVLGEGIPMVDVLTVARTLLLANYDLEDDEVNDLLEVDPGPESEALAAVVLESLFGPDQKTRGYVDWVRASLLANGLTMTSIPASAINDVLSILVATNRTIPSSQFVDASRLAHARDTLERFV